MIVQRSDFWNEFIVTSAVIGEWCSGAQTRGHICHTWHTLMREGRCRKCSRQKLVCAEVSTVELYVLWDLVDSPCWLECITQGKGKKWLCSWGCITQGFQPGHGLQLQFWGSSELMSLTGGYHIYICICTKIMASSPITSKQIDGKTMETVADFIFLGSKITADGDCSHEIKTRLLLGRKAMTNLDRILKSRDITLPTKVHLFKAMVFPVVTYGCESWTIKKAEHWRIDAFEPWCWRRLLRAPWTAGRSSQSILKEISPEYSLEGLMLKLKL